MRIAGMFVLGGNDSNFTFHHGDVNFPVDIFDGEHRAYRNNCSISGKHFEGSRPILGDGKLCLAFLQLHDSRVIGVAHFQACCRIERDARVILQLDYSLLTHVSVVLAWPIAVWREIPSSCERRQIGRSPFSMETPNERIGGCLFNGWPRGVERLGWFSGHDSPSSWRRSSASRAIPLAKCLFTALRLMPSMSATAPAFICSSRISISTVRVRTFISSRARAI